MSLWTDGTIKLDVTPMAYPDAAETRGLKFKSVSAKLLTPFAVLPSLLRSGKWMLVHAHTGLLIVPLDSEEACYKVGEYLRVNLVTPFREKTREDVLAVMPPWVESWLKECQEAGRFTAPPRD